MLSIVFDIFATVNIRWNENKLLKIEKTSMIAGAMGGLLSHTNFIADSTHQGPCCVVLIILLRLIKRAECWCLLCQCIHTYHSNIVL
jgi:hypothetical protein